MAHFKLRTNKPKSFAIKLNEEQKQAKNSIMHEQIVVLTARAGCGKTATTAAAALDLLFRGEINKLYITRPTVTIGKDIGYLPGDTDDKLGPYLEGIKKVMIDVYAGINNAEKIAAIENRFKSGQIELIPIQFLRSYTIGEKEMLVVTEAQNTTAHEMEAILTRLGKDARIVIEGDIRQKDTKSKDSGLTFAIELSEVIEGIKFHELKENHRSGIVKEILDYVFNKGQI